MKDFNIDKYRPYIAELEMDETAKDELLRALWQIMCAFVDLGWGVNSIHFALPELAEITSDTEEDELKCIDLFIESNIGPALQEPPEKGDS